MGALTLTREQLHEALRALAADRSRVSLLARPTIERYAVQPSIAPADLAIAHRLARTHAALLPQHLSDQIRYGKLETGMTETPATPPATIAPAPPPKRRGRRPDGATAATPAERAKRWRQAHAVRTVALPGDIAERMREEARRRELTKARLLAALLEGLR